MGGSADPRGTQRMQGTARDILSTEFAVVDPQATLAAAEQLLAARGVEELYVVDESQRLLGIIPDYVFLRRRLVPDAARCAGEIMSTHVVTACPDATLGELAARLRMHVHSRIPIVEEDRLIGIVTRRRLLQVLTAADAGEIDAELLAAPVRPQPPAAPKFLKSPQAAALHADAL